ncbi:MAG: HAD family hydrolase [Eubacteriales bacterium]|nr:HAD family hydrolase [Eubacteriales bacterium]
MIKACIFDCDGTLLDTLESIGTSANRTLREMGFSEIPMEDYNYLVGDGADELIRRCLRRNGDEACEHFPETRERYRINFAEGCMYHVRPYEGIRRLLRELHAKGIRTAVLSNKPHEQTLEVIDTFFEKTDFDYVLGAGTEIPRKPAPDGALLIAKQFGLDSEEILYIGDTNTDMQTGNAAKMHTVGVLWGFRDRRELEEHHAEYIVEKPQDILKYL